MTRELKTGPARILLMALGFVFAGLGAVGAFLPVLPTTPFVLLAAACFARTSPTFHRRLIENRLFGTYIEQWQRHGTIPVEAKRKAYGLVVGTFALSIFLVDPLWLRLTLAGVALALILFLVWLPSTSKSEHD